MKTTELREMTMDELKAHEVQLAEDLARMRIQLAIKRQDDPLKVRITRRDLARVKTIITERERAGERASSKPAGPAAE